MVAMDCAPPSLGEIEKFEDQYNSISANPQKVLCVQLIDLSDQGKTLLDSEKWNEDICPLYGADIPQDELLSTILSNVFSNLESVA
jgi:hypothetical protein